MRLQILTPVQVALDGPVAKVVAEAVNGFFCLLPRHADFVTALVPGILSYTDPDGNERLMAVDEGTLVKCAGQVLVSTRSAIPGEDLDSLSRVVAQEFLELDERERLARSALARLEAGAVRGLLHVQDRGRGA